MVGLVALFGALNLLPAARADIGGANATMLPTATTQEGFTIGVGAAAVGFKVDGEALALAGPEGHVGIGLGEHAGVSFGAAQLMTTNLEGLTCLNGSVRVGLVQGERTLITPWGAGLACDQGRLGVAVPDLIGAIGVAVETGTERVRLDLSVPVLNVVTTGEDRGFSALAPLFSEVGVSVEVAPGQTLRLGTASMMPGLSYQGVFGFTSVEVAAHALAWRGDAAGFARASVAWSW